MANRTPSSTRPLDRQSDHHDESLVDFLERHETGDCPEHDCRLTRLEAQAAELKVLLREVLDLYELEEAR